METLRQLVRTFEAPLARSDLLLAVAVIVLGACGTSLLLPHRHARAKPRRVHFLGGGLVGLSLVLLAALWTPPGPLLMSLFFYAFGLAAIACGVAMISTRDPVYSALWFAGVVLATSGLFLLSGAQFLAAGTVIVYAGAIIVTFLFVIMLAQSAGQARYDRAARAPARATFSCYLLLWGLLYALLVARASTYRAEADRASGDPRRTATGAGLVPGHQLAGRYRIVPDSSAGIVLARSIRPTARLPDPAHPGHVAGLGGTLYTDHLISAELAGVLLFVALIGALSLAAPKPPVRPGGRGPAV